MAARVNRIQDSFLDSGFSDGIGRTADDRDAPQFVRLEAEQKCFLCNRQLDAGQTAIRWAVGGKVFYRHNTDCPK